MECLRIASLALAGRVRRLLLLISSASRLPSAALEVPHHASPPAGSKLSVTPVPLGSAHHHSTAGGPKEHSLPRTVVVRPEEAQVLA